MIARRGVMLIAALAPMALGLGCEKGSKSPPPAPPPAKPAHLAPGSPAAVERAIRFVRLTINRGDQRDVPRDAPPLVRAAAVFAHGSDSETAVLARQLQRAGVSAEALIDAAGKLTYEHERNAAEFEIRLAFAGASGSGAAGSIDLAVGELFNPPEQGERVAEVLDRASPDWRQTPAARALADKLLAMLASGKADLSVHSLLARRLAQPALAEAGRHYLMTALFTDYPSADPGDHAPPPEELAAIRLAAVRQASAVALARLRDARAVGPILDALQSCLRGDGFVGDPTRTIAPRLCAALTAIKPDWPTTPAAAPAVTAVLRTLLREETRSVGIDCLAAMPLPPRAVEPLLALMPMSSKSTRQASIWTIRPKARPIRMDLRGASIGQPAFLLARSGEKRAAPAARELLNHPSDYVRRDAAVVLAAVAGGQAVDDLVRLADRDSEMLPTVLLALGLTDSPSAIGPLGNALRTGYLSASGASRDALFASLPAEEQERLTNRYGSREEAIKRFVPRMEQTNAPARRTALSGLTLLSCPEVLPVLRAAMDDSDAVVRCLAMRDLARRGDREGLPRTVAALNGPRRLVAATAAAALADLNDPQAVAALAGALSRPARSTTRPGDDDDDDRDRGYDPDERALEYVGEHTSAAQCALEAMIRLKSAEALSTLVQVAPYRRDALHALTLIDPAWADRPEVRRVVPALCRDLSGPTIVLLGLIGDAAAVDPLIAAMGRSGEPELLAETLDQLDAQWRSRPAAARKRGELIAAVRGFRPPTISETDTRSMDYRQLNRLRDEWSAAWMSAAESATLLGRLGDESAVDALLACLAKALAVQPNDRSQIAGRLAGVCAEAIGRIGSKTAVEPLLGHLAGVLAKPAANRSDFYGRPGWTSPECAIDLIDALGRIADPRAVPVLLKVFERPAEGRESPPMSLSGSGRSDPETRSAERSAAAALVRIGGRPAIHGLIAALSHPPVRCVVAAALADSPAAVPEAVEPLIATLATPAGAGIQVFDALDKLDANWRRRPSARGILNTAIEALCEPNSDLRLEDRRFQRPGRSSEQACVFVLDHLDRHWRTTASAGAMADRLARKLQVARQLSSQELAALAETHDRRGLAALLALPLSDARPDELGRRIGDIDADTLLRALDALDENWPAGKAAADAVPKLVEAVKKWWADRNKPADGYRSRSSDPPLAASVLARIADRRVGRALLDLLRSVYASADEQDRDVFLRSRMLDLACQAASPELIDALLADLGKADDATATIIVNVMERHQWSAYVQGKLLAAAISPDPAVRKQAVGLIVLARASQLPESVTADLAGDAKRLAELCGSVEASLADDGPEARTMRELTIGILRRVRDPASAPGLVKLFIASADRVAAVSDDRRRADRGRLAAAALAVLARIGEPSVAPGLAECLARLAGKIDWPKLRDRESYQDSDSDALTLALRIAETLAQLGDGTTLPAVSALAEQVRKHTTIPWLLSRTEDARNDLALAARLRSAVEAKP